MKTLKRSLGLPIRYLLGIRSSKVYGYSRSQSRCVDQAKAMLDDDRVVKVVLIMCLTKNRTRLLMNELILRTSNTIGSSEGT